MHSARRIMQLMTISLLTILAATTLTGQFLNVRGKQDEAADRMWSSKLAIFVISDFGLKLKIR